MSETFYRQYVTWDLDGTFTTPGQNDWEAALAAYVTDGHFWFNRQLTISADGTYYITYTWELVDPPENGPPALLIKWKYVRETDEQGTHRTTYSWDDSSQQWVDVTDPEQNEDTFLLRNGLVLVDLYAGMDETLVTGAYVVNEEILEGEDPYDANEIGRYDLRALVISNIRAEKPRFHPHSEDNTTLIKADVVTLPVSSTLFPNGWVPDGDVDWVMNLKIRDGDETVIRDWSGSFTPDLGEDGKIGAIEEEWDGTDAGEENLIEIDARFEARALAPVADPSLGNTLSQPKNNGCICCRCCPTCKGFSLLGCLRQILSFQLVSTPSGPSMDVDFTYISFDADRQPASLGFGWHSTASVRILEQANGDLVYRDESGSFARWTLSGSDYVPLDPANYTEAVKNQDDTYTLTFKDQSHREFDEDGRLVADVDRNDLTVTYTYSSGNLSTVSDGRGRTLYYDYGSRTDGQPESIRANNSSTGKQVQFEYCGSSDPNGPEGRLKLITDPAGETTEFFYDSDGRMIEIHDTRDEVAVAYTYDELGRVETATYYGERQSTCSYGTSLNTWGTPHDVPTLSVTDTDLVEETERTTTLQHDLLSKVVASIDPIGNVTRYFYEDTLNPKLLTTMLDPNLFDTIYTYNSQGNLTQIQDAQDNVTAFAYVEDFENPVNPKHRNLILNIFRPDVTVNGDPVSYDPTVFSYDDNGNLTEILDAQQHSLTFEVTDGQITAITDRRWDGEPETKADHTTVFTYNETNGNLETITYPAGPDPAPARQTSLTYDDYDNVISVDDGDGHVWEYEFDDNSRLIHMTDARGKVVDYNYEDGRLDNVEAPPNQGSGANRRKTYFTYDTPGRPLQVDSDISTTSEVMRVAYEYDAFSQLRKLKRQTDGPETQRSTSYSYDELGRNTGVEDPLTRQSSTSYDPFCAQFIQTTARGVQRTYTRDSLCRLTEVEVKDGSDLLDEKNEFSYDELGRLVKITQTHGARYNKARFGISRYGEAGEDRLFEYDSLDRLIKVTFPLDDYPGETPPNLPSIQYAYDPEGNLISMTDVAGNVTEYTYYNDNRLHQVIVKRDQEDDRVFEYFYDDSGRLLRIVYPESTGIEARFDAIYGEGTISGWNENGQLTSLRYLKDSAHLHSFAYEYDDSGNRIALLDTPQNTANPIRWEYGYDWLNRLTEVKKGVGELATPEGVTTVALYGYDESDNRIRFEIPDDDEVHTYTYDDADQILTRSITVGLGSPDLVESFEHNDDGMMTLRTLAATSATTEYVWNDSDRLIQIKKQPSGDVTANKYDSGGIRKQKVDKDRTKLKSFYSGLPTVNEYSTQRGAATVPTQWVLGHQVLGFDKDGDFFWLVTDGLSSCRVVVDEDGDVQASYNSDEFGNSIEVDEDGASTSARWVGGLGVRDETGDSGLYYMRQRFYDSGVGRFVSRDPIVAANPYTYAENNPINLVDPLGLWSWPGFLEGAGGAFLAGVAGMAVGLAVVTFAPAWLAAGLGVAAAALAGWGLGLALNEAVTGKDNWTDCPLSDEQRSSRIGESIVSAALLATMSTRWFRQGAKEDWNWLRSGRNRFQGELNKAGVSPAKYAEIQNTPVGERGVKLLDVRPIQTLKLLGTGPSSGPRLASPFALAGAIPGGQAARGLTFGNSTWANRDAGGNVTSCGASVSVGVGGYGLTVGYRI